jgi:hypothetical protein
MIHPQECISREPDSSECKRAFPLPIPKTSADDQKNPAANTRQSFEKPTI